jgi:hypothetical protein
VSYGNKKAFLSVGQAREVLKQCGITRYKQYRDWKDRPAGLPREVYRIYGSFTILLSEEQRTHPIPDHHYVVLALYNTETTNKKGWLARIARCVDLCPESVLYIIKYMREVEANGFTNLRRPNAGRLGRTPRVTMRAARPFVV